VQERASLETQWKRRAAARNLGAVRRAVVLASILAIPAIALAAASCDEAGTIIPSADASTVPKVEAAAPQADGGTEAEPDAPSVEEAATFDACGPGPWVTLGIVVVALDLSDPDGSLLPGAEFTSPLCPGLVKVSNDAGVIEGQISRDVPFYGRLTATDYISELAPEEVFDADSTGNQIEMLPQILAGILPGYQADASAIVIAAEKTQDDAGVCSSLDGITLSVVGHPEATVTYFSTASIPLPVPEAGETTTRGFAAITGLTGTGQFVTLAGTKPGCTVVFARGPITGRVPLENGFVSLMPAYLTP
jgi:hypothetical protein